MARFRCFSWLSLRWCLLLCLLPVGAFAATRNYPTLPNAQTVASQGSATGASNGLLSIAGPLVGDYIERTGTGTAGTPIKVLPRIDFSIPRTISQGTSLLKGGVQGLVIGAALQAMLDAVGGFIDNQGNAVKDGPASSPPSIGDSDYYWVDSNLSNIAANRRASADDACSSYVPSFSGAKFDHSSKVSDTKFDCYYSYYSGSNKVVGSVGSADRYGTSCPSGYTYNNVVGSCQKSSSPIPLTDTDYGDMASFAAGQNAAWLQDLLNEACSGAPSAGVSVASCVDSLKEQTFISGPSSVSGPSTTSTTTGSNGQSSTTVTNTTYDITYGSSYYDYRTTTTVTTTSSDGNTSTTQTSDDPAVTEENNNDTSSPCSSGCDGPAYTDRYTPVSYTKESVIDDFRNRMSSLPIITAATSFFSVSVGSSCPVWQVSTSIDAFGVYMPINLLFDYHCQNWFISYQFYAQAVVALVCAFIAFRVGILD